MNRIKVADNFYLDELVDPRIYLIFGGKSLWFINPKVIDILQFLRNRFGPIIVNNWSQQGKVSAQEFIDFPLEIQQKYYHESGVRIFDTTEGAEYSQHKFGRAADPKFLKSTPDIVRADIIKNYETDYKPLGLTTIEADTESWVHFDCRNTGLKTLYIVGYYSETKD